MKYLTLLALLGAANAANLTPTDKVGDYYQCHILPDFINPKIENLNKCAVRAPEAKWPFGENMKSLEDC